MAFYLPTYWSYVVGIVVSYVATDFFSQGIFKKGKANQVIVLGRTVTSGGRAFYGLTAGLLIGSVFGDMAAQVARVLAISTAGQGFLAFAEGLGIVFLIAVHLRLDYRDIRRRESSP